MKQVVSTLTPLILNATRDWRSQFLSEWFHATKLVAFRIEGVNETVILADGGSLMKMRKDHQKVSSH